MDERIVVRSARVIAGLPGGTYPILAAMVASGSATVRDKLPYPPRAAVNNERIAGCNSTISAAQFGRP